MTAVFKQVLKQKAGGRSVNDCSGPLRRCLVSGDMKPRELMVRFVLDPSNAVVPDLAEDLPGHGFWVTASETDIQSAVKKKLFAKVAKKAVRVSETLASDVEALLRKRCLNFLGLAKGAGVAVLGENQTEAALRANKIALYFRAPDAGAQLDNRHSVPLCTLFSREELGAAFGFDRIVYAGLMPHGVTKKIKLEIQRLKGMTVGAED